MGCERCEPADVVARAAQARLEDDRDVRVALGAERLEQRERAVGRARVLHVDVDRAADRTGRRHDAAHARAAGVPVEVRAERRRLDRDVRLEARRDEPVDRVEVAAREGVGLRLVGDGLAEDVERGARAAVAQPGRDAERVVQGLAGDVAGRDARDDAARRERHEAGEEDVGARRHAANATALRAILSIDDRRDPTTAHAIIVAVVGDDIQLLLDGLAGDLGASLALEDLDQRLLAHTDHATPIDDVRLASLLGRRATPEVRAWFEQWGIRDADGPVRTPPGPEIGALARWCLPVRFRRTALGYVWILDDGRLAPDDLGPAADVAGQIGGLLYRRQLAERADAELLRLLVLPHEADDGALADAYPHRGPLALVAAGRADGDDLERAALAEAVIAARRAAESFPPGTAIAAGIGGLVAAAVPLRATGDLGPAHRFAASVIAHATRQLRGLELAVGIGGVATGAGGASASHAEARRALRIARALPAFGPIAAWDALGVFRALALIPPEHVATGCSTRACGRCSAARRSRRRRRPSSTQPAMRSPPRRSSASTVRRSTSGSPGSARRRASISCAPATTGWSRTWGCDSRGSRASADAGLSTQMNRYTIHSPT